MPHAATTDVDLGQRPVRLAERDGLHRGFWQTSYEAALAWGNGTGAGTIPGTMDSMENLEPEYRTRTR